MKLYLTLVYLTMVAFASFGQNGEAKNATFFDINADEPGTIHPLYSAALNIQYHDMFGQSNEIALTVANAKGEIVSSYALSKTYGINLFKIDLGSLYESWKEKDIYTFSLVDEMGRSRKILLKKSLPLSEEITLGILVNPVHMDCEAMAGNLVDVYGSIEGGKAPYEVNWYIMNEARNEFLYQPREQQIQRPGNTAVIRIDKNPAYHVMMLVRDACGKEQKQMVLVTCTESKKKVNTLFVEPLKKLPEQPILIR
jgi:hypothetical protein